MSKWTTEELDQLEAAAGKISSEFGSYARSHVRRHGDAGYREIVASLNAERSRRLAAKEMDAAIASLK
jgi:hypothetical protein